MLRRVGESKRDIRDVISEIYKNNEQYISYVVSLERQKEIETCKVESNAIIYCYREVLSQALKVIVESVLIDIEVKMSEMLPSFKYNADFIMGVMKDEIENDLPESGNLDFDQVVLVTGTQEHYEVFKNVFTIEYDESLGEDLILFKYKELTKTIDFSVMAENLLKDLRQCRKKYLSILDAQKMSD